MAKNTSRRLETDISKTISPAYEENYTKSQPHKVSIVVDEGDEDQKFYERHEFLTDKFEYARKGICPGKILIFHHEKFDTYNKRAGGRKDVNEIIITFQRLGFNITEDDIFVDLRKDQILNALKEVAEMDNTENNCLIVFFLTHGSDNDVLVTYGDDSLQIQQILQPFIKCKSFKNKPKMFVFQACKGEDYSYSENSPRIDKKIHKIVGDSNLKIENLPRDSLLVYSTTEGNRAFRDKLNGTWFIQEMCKNFTSHSRRDDVVSLLIRVSKCISKNYYESLVDAERKQMPLIVSTLKKKFYLNQNKDRHTIIKVLNEKNEFINTLNLVKDKVDEIANMLNRKSEKARTLP